MDHIPTVLRKIFKEKVSPLCGQTSLGQWLKSKRVEPNFKEQRNYQLLYSGDVEKWDVSLLCHLLLREKKLECVNASPLLINQECNAVDKLREIRNEYFGHPAEGRISKDDLDTLIQHVEKQYKLLNVAQEDIDTLKAIPTS